MESLFPEMELEIRSDRKAARRERAQHERQYLRARDLNWLINRLLDRGPATEHVLLLEVMEEEYEIEDGSNRSLDLLRDLFALSRVGKLWAKPVGIHPGSGEKSYLFGIKGVHKY